MLILYNIIVTNVIIIVLHNQIHYDMLNYFVSSINDVANRMTHLYILYSSAFKFLLQINIYHNRFFHFDYLQNT